MPLPVKVIAHDPAWKSMYQTETEKIVSVLGKTILRSHHIGSTSIPGIFAKPVIDILLEVDDINQVDASNSAMKELGYEVIGEYGIIGRRFFRKDNEAGLRTYHVHAYQSDNPEIARHLAFRDYMVAHPDEAQNYSALKQQLAQAHPDDYPAYIAGKDSYIKEQEAKAMAWWAARQAS